MAAQSERVNGYTSLVPKMEEHNLWQHTVRPKPRIAVAVWPLSMPIFFSLPKPYHIKAPFIPGLLFPIHSSDPQRPLLSQLLFSLRPPRPKGLLYPHKNPPTPAATTQPHLLQTTTLHSAPQDREYLLTANVSKTKTKKKKSFSPDAVKIAQTISVQNKVPSLQQHAPMPDIRRCEKALP